MEVDAMETYAACTRNSRGDAEGLFADIATSDGIDWDTRMTAVERAVGAADRSAAQAALDLLRAVLQAAPEPDDEALSQRLAAIRDSR
jgi:hypothetical protein